MTEIAVRTKFPRRIREIENTWIPMPDGTRLAARIWLPEDAEDNPVPAILEYLPYRKRDGTVERDHLTHPYLAGFGYAGVRVDLRGTGDSEGICRGEYLLQEQDDCLGVIDWLASQPWCSGSVGMIGISWGGFNGLQVAARKPEPLGAVISICSTDDRYGDDIHFMGGAALTDKLAWGATAFAIANTPPDPALVGSKWRDMWRERIEGNGLWMIDWFRHQRRDDFYAHGSICEDYNSVEVPVYLVGGWADGYTNAIFRMLDRLPGPRKGLVGPWAHKYPHFAQPGPRIGFLQECLRWWDQHLKGIDTGIMDEPMLRAWIQENVVPASSYAERPGRWVAEPNWKGTAIDHSRLHVGRTGLVDMSSTDLVELNSPQNAGHTAGNWCVYGEVPDGPIDQNGDSGLVAAFESEPFSEDVDLLGFPVLETDVTSDTPQAILAAVLSIVGRSGKATQFSYGLLNLTHRNGHQAPRPMPLDRAEHVRIQMNACGQRIAKGERLRLALSNAFWPIAWPAQSAGRLKLTSTHVDLPIRASREDDRKLPDFQNPEGATPLEVKVLEEGSYERKRSIDYVSGIETYERNNCSGARVHLHTGIETRVVNRETFCIDPDDPNSASGQCFWNMKFSRDDWQAELEASVKVEALHENWRIRASLSASDASGLVAERNWAEEIKRDLV